MFLVKMTAVSALHFLALYIIIGAALRLLEAYLLERDPDSAVGKALAFIH